MTLAVGTKRAVGYFRVSDPHQTGERHSSLETQEERFRLHCERHGYTPVATFTDVKSGRRDDRHEYQRMLAYIPDAQANVIVVQWLDRFGRKPREILRRYWALEEQGVAVEATDEDLKEELILLIKAGLAGAESRKISERVKANMGRAIAKGVHVGRPPYGLHPRKAIEGGKIATHWEIDPKEAPIVREMYRLAVEENKGYKAIADTLNDSGHRNRSGNLWGAWAVAKIFGNEAIMGTLTWGKEPQGGNVRQELVRVPDFFPAILSPEEWGRLQQRIAIRREMPKGKGHVSSYLLTGIARCGHCGSAMVGHSGSLARAGGRHHNYACGMARACRARCPIHNNHTARRLEAAVLDYLGQYSDPQRVRELLAKDTKSDTTGLDAQLAKTEKRLAALDKDFLQNLDLLKQGVVNQEEFTKANEARRQERQTLEARAADLKARMEASKRQHAQLGAIPREVASFLEVFRTIDARHAKAKLQTILKAAYVYRDGRIELEFRT